MRKTARVTCAICRDVIPQPRTGRTRRTCSAACRQKLYEARHPQRKRARAFRAKQRRAAKKVAVYETAFGDLSQVPGGRYPGGLDLKRRLVLHEVIGIPTGTCWVCHRPYIREGTRSDTCSRKCTRAKSAYFKRLEKNFYSNPRRTPDDVMHYIRKGMRLDFCAHCDDPYVPTRKDRKYCTARCRKAAYQKREAVKAQRREQARLARRTMRQTKQKVYKTVCGICGTHFTTLDPRQRYCKLECQNEQRNRRRRVPRDPLYRDCAECGTKFEVTWRYRGVHYHCTPACLLQAIERGMRPSAMGRDRKCIMCGTEYRCVQAKMDIQVYCSNRCNHAGWKLAEYDIDAIFGAAPVGAPISGTAIEA
jgi:hypothetical protein